MRPVEIRTRDGKTMVSYLTLPAGVGDKPAKPLPMVLLVHGGPWARDGYGFDIASFEPDGRERLIEVKTTNGWERTPFHISQNEIAIAETRRDEWHLVRVWNFARQPKAFSLRPPLSTHIDLTPTSFLAALR